MKPGPNLLIHQVGVEQGEFILDQTVNLNVDQEHRQAVARNHTCTHLLHAALRRMLGEHVKQSGSLVSANRLRFDFTHIHPLSDQELEQVEQFVNAALLEDIPLESRIVPYARAKEEEALGIFTEKYQDEVRVVEIPGRTKELCGGTHLERTGQAGAFCIVSETGIAAGIRRIEAATGWNFLEVFKQQQQVQQTLAALVKTRPEDLVQKVSEMQEQLKKSRKEIEALQTGRASITKQSYHSRVEFIEGVPFLALRVDLPEGAGMKGLRSMLDEARSDLQQGVILLAAEYEGKACLVLFVSPELHSRCTAPELIQVAAREVAGSGGGRPDMAQAGGSDPGGIDRALQRLKELLKQKLEQ